MNPITIFLNKERVDYLLKTPIDGFSIKVKTDIQTDLYEVIITFDDNVYPSLAFIKMFHLGINYGFQLAQKEVTSLYKPNQFKHDDVMGLAHD